MRIIVFTFSTILLLLLFATSYGQQRIEGIVMDKNTKQRIARVFVHNLTTGSNVFNNSKGEFSIDVNNEDILVANREEYGNDTLIYKGQKALIFNLKRTSIYIQPVTVVAQKTPEQILAERRVDYEKAFRLSDGGDYFTVGPSGAGLSINAIYSLFSKEAKNARRLTNYFQKEYEANVIDTKFSRALVSSVTGLKDELLENFIIMYRPSYNFAITATTYQMTKYILSKYDIFKVYPYYKPLPKLQILQQDENKE